MKAAIYARVSTTGKGQDVQLQVDLLRRVAEQRGYSIAGEYVDDGVSGAKANRPALDRLRADARAAKFDIVLVARLDRLGRSLVDLLTLMQELTAQGVGFASIADAGIDTTTATGKLMLHLLAAFAEFERALIRERIEAGVAKARAAGKKFGRRRAATPALPAAVKLVADGYPLKEAARLAGISRNTLRRRLVEAGQWPPTTLGPEVAPADLGVGAS